MHERFCVRGAQRGQAIVETALFMPIMLLLILSIVYLSQAGVAQERGQAAVRYGSLVSPVQNYSLPAVYAAYDAGLSSPILPQRKGRFPPGSRRGPRCRSGVI